MVLIGEPQLCPFGNFYENSYIETFKEVSKTDYFVTEESPKILFHSFVLSVAMRTAFSALLYPETLQPNLNRKNRPQKQAFIQFRSDFCSSSKFYKIFPFVFLRSLVLALQIAKKEHKAIQSRIHIFSRARFAFSRSRFSTVSTHNVQPNCL